MPLSEPEALPLTAVEADVELLFAGEEALPKLVLSVLALGAGEVVETLMLVLLFTSVLAVLAVEAELVSEVDAEEE